MEKSPGTARDQDRGDSGSFIEVADAGDKRRDRLFVARYDLCHQFIADHEIGRAGIFVDQEQPGTCPYSLNDIGCLRRAAARVRSGETDGVFAVREVADEQRNVDVRDAAPVFRAHLHCRVVRYDKFPSVAADMIINTLFERAEECGFAVVSAADDQSDASSDPHSPHGAGVRKVQRDCQRFRAPEQDRVPHRHR